MLAIQDSTADLASIDTVELRRQLASAIGSVAAELVNMARIWSELERRGEDLTDLRHGLGRYLPAIAAGTILPELVVEYAGSPTLLKALANLTPNDQRKIIDDPRVPIAERNGSTTTVRMLPVNALTTPQIRLAFNGHVRSETEQAAILFSPPPAYKPKKVLRHGKVRIDRINDTVAIGKSQVRIQEMVDALRASGVIA